MKKIFYHDRLVGNISAMNYEQMFVKTIIVIVRSQKVNYAM
ncbi:hypothetical protein L965_850 [Leuconostoc pseudomesenteroides PS12]|nr:hypothetical protein L964_882 [Leuconostoc pseudomesenteroides 1159]KDA49759.1 hypothetical protein L965_850 [Leuconostoc pseudomesenteroides PS12]CCJ66872.1 hypothetical protein Q5C_02410 [Leuconostoc pseudomesenteroides 4882]